MTVLVTVLVLGASLVLTSTASALNVDWAMPNRLSPAIERSWASNPWGLPSASYVSPASWNVELFLTDASGKPACPDVDRHFIWTVSGEGVSETPGRPLTGAGSGSGINCRVTATVPKLGVYDVKATEFTNQANGKGEYLATGNVYENPRVIVRDWLIVGLGDSNASGEGNPPWIYGQCDRSLDSYQNMVADYVGLTDPRTSVTFIPAGCSGARIGNLTSTPYVGIDPKLGPPLPPQITQVKSLIRSRAVDAVITSIGINNIYFSPLLEFCFREEEAPDAEKHCNHVRVKVETSDGEVSGYSNGHGKGPTLEALTRAAVGRLPGLYGGLAPQLTEALHPAHVFITQYPNIATAEDGEICGPVGPVPHFSSSTWGWLNRTGAALNDAIAATARLGWEPVTGIPEAFVGHGYCSARSYFLPFHRAFLMGDTSGAFHASVPGQRTSAEFTARRVCQAFYGNPKCRGIAPPLL